MEAGRRRKERRASATEKGASAAEVGGEGDKRGGCREITGKGGERSGGGCEREKARWRWRRLGGHVADRSRPGPRACEKWKKFPDLDLDERGHLEGVRCTRLRYPSCTAAVGSATTMAGLLSDPLLVAPPQPQ